jgi:hypothetical protein
MADPELARQYPTRAAALAEYWALSRQIAALVRQLRALRRYVNARWGRAPKIPQW